jgi:hypothetical protein
MADLQLVILRGGTHSGRPGYAPARPGALRLYFSEADRKWSELYLYTDEFAPLRDHGDVPVMTLMQTRDEPHGDELPS